MVFYFHKLLRETPDDVSKLFTVILEKSVIGLFWNYSNYILWSVFVVVHKSKKLISQTLFQWSMIDSSPSCLSFPECRNVKIWSFFNGVDHSMNLIIVICIGMQIKLLHLSDFFWEKSLIVSEISLHRSLRFVISVDWSHWFFPRSFPKSFRKVIFTELNWVEIVYNFFFKEDSQHSFLTHLFVVDLFIRNGDCFFLIFLRVFCFGLLSLWTFKINGTFWEAKHALFVILLEIFFFWNISPMLVEAKIFVRSCIVDMMASLRIILIVIHCDASFNFRFL